MLELENKERPHVIAQLEISIRIRVFGGRDWTEVFTTVDFEDEFSSTGNASSAVSGSTATGHKSNSKSPKDFVLGTKTKLRTMQQQRLLQSLTELPPSGEDVGKDAEDSDEEESTNESDIQNNRRGNKHKRELFPDEKVCFS